MSYTGKWYGVTVLQVATTIGASILSEKPNLASTT